MNTNNITVTPDVLDATAHDLEMISTDLKNCFGRITYIISEIRNNWKDAQGAKFSSRYEGEVKPKLENYYNAIMNHSRFIVEASRIYQTTIGSINQSVN